MGRSRHEGRCYFCGEHGPLTIEHIPPKAAFNKHPLLLQRVSDQSAATGQLTWQNADTHHAGYSVVSLCSRCNELAGRKFAPSYIDLAKTVAERVGSIPYRHQITIQKVRKPQLILRQVLFQFVSAVGPHFVDRNLWIRHFMERDGLRKLPDDVFIYIFALNEFAFRTSGMSGNIDVHSNQIRIVSEFTFWPLGTLLSFTELPSEGFTPIHDWDRFPYGSNETVDLTLWVNPVNTALPGDFRKIDEIRDGINAPAPGAINLELIPEMRRLVRLRSGNESDNEMLMAHPSQVDMVRVKPK